MPKYPTSFCAAALCYFFPGGNAGVGGKGGCGKGGSAGGCAGGCGKGAVNPPACFLSFFVISNPRCFLINFIIA